MKAWHALEHKVYAALKNRPPPGPNLIVAVSGGRDSMALLHLLHGLSRAQRWRLLVAHVDHGPEARDPAQTEYRRRARQAVAHAAQSLGWPFFTNAPTGFAPVSEAALRELRYSFLQQLQIQQDAVVVTGHHAQDLLETRLINLLRGSGPRGLSSLKTWSPDRRVWRPLLESSAREVQAYADDQGLEFLSDPSNKNLGPLRNWIRHHWLSELETKREGATFALARSLDLLDRVRAVPVDPMLVRNGVLHRSAVRESGKAVRAAAVVELFRQNKIRSYTKGHVDEFLKRLDTRRKRFSFRLLQENWIADAERVKLHRDQTTDRQSI